MPYRLRARLDQMRILGALRGLKRTAPRPATPPERADAEVHMLVCGRDAELGVLALKSLLRFPEMKLAVSVSDDGSLTPGQRAFLETHVPGLRWLDWPHRDGALDEFLHRWPRIRKLYVAADYAPSAKLVHPLALARCPRVLLIDSDTAFFRRPDRLIEFVRGDDSRPWYMHDHQDEAATVPPEAREAFAELEKLLLPPGRPWGLRHSYFNSGMLAYRVDAMNVEAAEKYLAWHETAPARYTSGKAAIWFGRWTPEQTAYLAMYAVADPPPRPLGDDYHLGGGAGHVFNHFLRHYVVQERVLREIRRLIAEL